MVRRRFSGISPEGGFAEALDRLFRRKGLSIRERHVLSLLMLGHSYNGIAEELGIAIDTVRKHVRSIHGKTGVHNQLEIFAKYLTFTPLPPVTAEARPGSRDAARRGHAPDARAPRRPTDGGSAERLIAFMNALPMTATSTALLREMHGALHALVDDAWISSTFDMSLDLAATELASQSPRPAVKPQRSGTMLTFSEKGIHVDPETPARGMAARLLDDHRSDGVQMERYHPPILLDYHHAGEEIGGIILWREIGKTPTSRETLDLFEELRPFLTTLFCDLTLRHQYSEPMLAILSNALGELLGREPGSTLTTAEEDVLTLRLMGHSHKSIGEMLGITVNTVKKHGNAINRKMGTSGAADLFARHLAPLIGLDDPFEKSGATLHQHALDGVGVG